MRVVGVTALLVAASLAIAAAASGALTPSAYRAQANAICQKALDDDATLARAGTHTAAQQATYLTGLVRVFNAEYTALSALQPPASLVAAHRKALWADWYWLRSLAAVAKVPGTMYTPGNPAWTTYYKLYAKKSKAWAATGATACSY